MYGFFSLSIRFIIITRMFMKNLNVQKSKMYNKIFKVK